jgi:outer membrane receptor for ferrienterochelin and colicins
MYFNHTNTPLKSTHRKLAVLAAGLLSSASVLAESVNKINMETLVVTATQTEHSELEAPASVSVITGEELEGLAVNDVAEAISTLPGIHLNQGTAYGRNEIKIRGLDSDYTLILVNGRRLYSRDALSSTNGNDFDLSSIPMSAIERIEVVSGPMSSLYGADALGGVVNVILKDATEKTHASVGYLYENITEGSGGDTHKLNANVSGALIKNKLLGSLYIDTNERDAWESEFNDIGTTLEERKELNIATNLKWLINDNQEVDFDLRYNQDHRDSDYSYYGNAYDVVQDLDRINLAVTHTSYWESLDSRLSYNIDHIDLTNDSELNGEVADIVQINQTLNAQLSKDIGSNKITGGTEFSVTSLENNLTLDDETVSYTTAALYLQDEVEFGDLAVTLGGRLDSHEVYGSEFSPRLYGVYSLTDKWVIKGGIGKAFKAPTLAQYDEDYAVLSCRGSCYQYGNADLEAETSTSYEISTSYQADNFGGSVTLFKNDIENMIAYDSSVVYSAGVYVSGDVTYQNIDKATLEGVELNLWYDLTDAVSVSGNYTYTDAEDKTDHTELVQTPTHVGNVSLNWQTTETLSTSVAYQYTGEQYVSSVSDANLSEAYKTVNLAMQYAPTKDINIKAGITNLLNEERDEVAENYYYALQSRSIYAGITYDF